MERAVYLAADQPQGLFSLHARDGYRYRVALHLSVDFDLAAGHHHGTRHLERNRMTDVPQETLVERTLSNLATAWRDIAQSAARTVGLSNAPVSTTPESLERLMRDCLEARGGEVSARMRAAALGDRKSVVLGKGVSVREDLGGRRLL